MRIPSGIASFSTIRREAYFYADKTPFLPQLESPEAAVKKGDAKKRTGAAKRS